MLFFDSFPQLFDVLLRGVISAIILFLLTKLMGAKQISQLTYFDYIIGISIGSIAAEMAFATDVPYLDSIAAMVVYSSLAILISYLSQKSIRARRILTGTPIVLIDNGKIVEKNLQKSRLDINEFLSQCRCSGYFDVADLAFAIMEPNGKISFLPKSEKRPLCPQDMNLTPAAENLVANVIIDGNMMHNNLRAVGKDSQWLQKQLATQNSEKISEILLATVDQNGCLTVFQKNISPKKYNLFD